jgi:hypothetical protein
METIAVFFNVIMVKEFYMKTHMIRMGLMVVMIAQAQCAYATDHLIRALASNRVGLGSLMTGLTGLGWMAYTKHEKGLTKSDTESWRKVVQAENDKAMAKEHTTVLASHSSVQQQQSTQK